MFLFRPKGRMREAMQKYCQKMHNPFDKVVRYLDNLAFFWRGSRAVKGIRL